MTYSFDYSAQKIRVMHIVETLDIGGAEKVIVDLVNHMPKEIIPYVCCLQTTGEMAAQLPRTTPVAEFLSPGGNNLKLPGQIADFIRNNRIDIIHAHNWNTYIEALLGSRFAGSIPVLHTIHGPYADYSPGLMSSLKKNLRKSLERWLAKKSCRVCVVSDAIEDYVIPHLSLPAEKVEVVINGVDTNQDFKAKTLMRWELGLKDEDIVFCFVGRLAKIKNIEYFLSVVLNLANSSLCVKVLLVGDGPSRGDLEAFVNKTGLDQIVRFLGFRSDIGDCLHCSDVFVLPSLYEGISVALLEAMSAGLPVVATDVGGNGQLVIDGETGYLVSLDEPDTFLAALVALATDSEKRKQMSGNARERVISHFSLERTVEHYLRIYHDCLKVKNSGTV